MIFQKFLKKVFQRFSQYAADPDDSEEWRIKKLVSIGIELTGILSWLLYGTLYISFNERPTAYICLAEVILYTIGLLSYKVFRRYGLHLYALYSIHMLGLILVHVLLGGFALSSVLLVWLIIQPLGLIAFYKPHHGLVLLLIVWAIFIIAGVLEPYYLRSSNNVPQTVINALYAVNLVSVTTYLTLGMYYFIRQNDILRQLVFNEQEKSESLLLNILPKEIVAILKNENRIIADHFDSTSILFADVVNFTPMSATMTPTDLVELLNEVYSYFDTLVEKYGLEKIKTIGDCYMVASGVPSRRLDHALVLTQLAIEIRDYVSQHTFRGHQLTFRIGLNSGSVVAGVIGKKKFTYDLWGDTVNTASRMESHSAGGSIQVTEATYDLIKEAFLCDPRGTIPIKGKGEMPVWLVLEKKL